MNRFQSYTHADRLLSFTIAIVESVEKLTMITDIKDVAHQLIKLSKERIAATSTRTAPPFHPGDYVYLSTKGLHIRSRKCKHLRDQRLGPYKVICTVGINSNNFLLPKECRLHPVFRCDLFPHASSSTSLRPYQTEIEGDHEEYAVDYISDNMIDN